jgi:hypothetical protein
VDVPITSYRVRNEGANPPIPNAHPFVATRGIEAQAQLCGLAGYEREITPEQLKKLYRNQKDYQTKFEQRLNELTRQGWSLPLYRNYILADAMKANFQTATN